MHKICKIAAIVLLFVLSAQAKPQPQSVFLEINNFLKNNVHNSLVDYQTIKKDAAELNKIVSALQDFEMKSLPGQNSEKAFWINAYNILVIHSVVSNYPISSPMDAGGFFDKQKHLVAGEKVTLNEIENIKLRKKFQDARTHFALVCAAIGCPPIINQAYTANKLDEQLDIQAEANLNSDVFIRVDNKAKKVDISEIFKWYKEDFITNGKTLLQYINQYRKTKIPENYSVNYYKYDWKLNEYKKKEPGNFLIKSNNLQAYTPSTLLMPGQFELKQFNNLYTQTAVFNNDADKTELTERSTFFTSITNFLYGLKPNINIGFDLYFKSVRYGGDSSSPFSVLKFSSGDNSRTAITSIAPKIKLSPFSKLPNLSVQTLLLIPLASNPDDEPFLDYDDFQWWTQFLYDRMLNSKFLIYIENGYFVRFGTDETVFTTPLKGILNYYPSDKWTFYLPTELAPSWDGFSWSSYYFQAGLGLKYQLTSNLELEALYTKFFLGKNSGAGITYNLGIRIIFGSSLVQMILTG